MNTFIPKLKSDLFINSPAHDTELIIPSGTILPASWSADIPITNIQTSWELKIIFSDNIPGIPGRKSCMWKIANPNTIPGQDGMIHIELAIDYDGWISLLVFSADRQLFSALSNGNMPQAPIEVSEELSPLISRENKRGYEIDISQPVKTETPTNISSEDSTYQSPVPSSDIHSEPQPAKVKKQSTFAARIRVELAKNNTVTTDDPPPILNRILSKSSSGDIRQSTSDLPLADSGPLVVQDQIRCAECDAVMSPDWETCPWCSVPVK